MFSKNILWASLTAFGLSVGTASAAIPTASSGETREFQVIADFSRDLENPSPNLSPGRREALSLRREALSFPPSLVGKGVRGLGFALAFSHNVKSQEAIEQPLALKVGVTIGGLGLIGLELWWFLFSKSAAPSNGKQE
ncbi:hypothetical protein [Nodularia sphaerocarpa]|uniref:hypothetical protein n=1 Tax=Nodularia sphaerocarpa TaxID=137816 RepID=UPI001EFAC4C5|nr:hypothetical protein [Nodularia sphaerocarpa]MDB9375942.1 hypothetical protein [Nodularia sphaerocarpa CS-585]ULP74690.1 hypothetical protein BDGGKGIB_04360 [Nodularia sphaerocarpa UHCC 0038]